MVKTDADLSPQMNSSQSADAESAMPAALGSLLGMKAARSTLADRLKWAVRGHHGEITVVSEHRRNNRLQLMTRRQPQA